MKFRQHRGGLTESLATTVELPASRTALADYISQELSAVGHWGPDELKFEPFPDPRCWPNQYLVKVDSYGVVGYIDELPPE